MSAAAVAANAATLLMQTASSNGGPPPPKKFLGPGALDFAELASSAAASGDLSFPRRERFVFRPTHLEVLEKYFQDNNYPSFETREEIAQTCNQISESAGTWHWFCVTYWTLYEWLILLYICTVSKQDAMLSQRGPRDATVHFDAYRILQQLCAVSLPQHAFLVGLCLQTAVNYLSESDKC